MAETGRNQEGHDSKVDPIEQGTSRAGSLGGMVFAALALGIPCGLLGMFAGCDIEIISFVRSGLRPGVQAIMWVGATVAFLAGVAVGVLRYHARPAGPKRREVHFDTAWFGAAWIAVSIAFFGTVAWITLFMPTTHGIVPIRLDRRDQVDVPFTAAYNDEYHVILDLKRTLPFSEMDNFVNMGGKQTASLPRPEIEWSVQGVREEDCQHFWSGQYFSRESIGLNLGTFKAERGHQYVVKLAVVKPSTPAQAMNPDVRVIVSVVSSDSLTFFGLCAFFGGMISGIFGLRLVRRGLAANRT